MMPDKPKKILFIEATDLKGGIETFILNTASDISPDKYELYLLTECEKASIENEFISLGGKIIRISPADGSKYRYIRDLNRVIRKGAFDIVHINKNSLSNPLPVILCSLWGVEKIILHSHNTRPANGRASVPVHRLFRLIFRFLKLERAACSDKAALWMFGRNKEYLLVKNGVDTEKYRYLEKTGTEQRIRSGISAQTFCVCSVGRLCEQKNPFFIVDIFEKITELHKDSRLFMIGSGNLRESIEEYIANKGLSGKIVIQGNRSDIPELLQMMDLFLMPSLYEGLPFAAIEAQAAGLPVLISDTVDPDVKILESSETESLDSSAEEWAAHCLNMRRYHRRDTTAEIIKSGYDIHSAVKALEQIYD